MSVSLADCRHSPILATRWVDPIVSKNYDHISILLIRVEEQSTVDHCTNSTRFRVSEEDPESMLIAATMQFL